MNLSEKAQRALNEVVAKFQSGDLSPIVAIASIRLPEDAPAAKWSFSNRVLAYAQTGTLDCRGYRQWQEVGRQVRKGERGAFIIAPRIVTETDDAGKKTRELCGFLGLGVFAYHQTDGEGDQAFRYEPKEPPPLREVAQAFGLDVRFGPMLGAYGATDSDTSVWLATDDVGVFFHELAHAAHTKADKGKRKGDQAERETVAEFTAAVLMELYGLGDRSGNAWKYIEHFATDPINAVLKALGTVERVLVQLEAVAAPVKQEEARA